jgi:Zinc finger C-x8-C-x5-C-x3-H type (and similar)
VWLGAVAGDHWGVFPGRWRSSLLVLDTGTALLLLLQTRQAIVGLNEKTMSFNAPIEDCRDFLRTGRCKYGMSCKYNHPSNVLNGGGIKPSDPSEFLLPIRPNEPVCDYYMKHRTCKFGSACKFNHPPLNATGSYSSAMMPPASQHQHPRRSEPAVQLLLSPVGTEATANGQVMMMQYLPQRPGEPDCIYFLKNRSCKYGATCRYHHPIQSQRPKQQRPAHEAFATGNSNGRANQQPQRVQYMTQVIPSYSHHQGQVLMSSESSGPVTLITVDGTSTQGYLVAGDAYCIPAGSVGFTEQSSSASSVGSSLETANGEFLGDHSRIRRNTSVGSFNSEVRQQQQHQQQQHHQQQQQQHQQGSYLPHSMSEGNIVQRRARAASFGSAGTTDGSQPPQRYEPPPNGLSWSQRARAASFGSRPDHQGQQQQQHQQQQQQQPYQYGSNSALPRHRSTGNVPGRTRANHGHDEGFTRMTSVLLNMLDTPEEAASECVSDEETPSSSNRVRPLRMVEPGDASAMLARLQLTPTDDDSADVPQEIIRTETSRNDSDRVGEEQQHHSAFLRSLSGGRDLESTTANNLRNGPSTSWFPSWTGSTEDDGELFSMLHQPHRSSQNSSHSPNGHGFSDVGMYLP